MWVRLIRQNNLKIDSLVYASNIDNKKIFIINEKSCLLNYLKISIKIWFLIIIIIWLENWERHMNMLYLIKK